MFVVVYVKGVKNMSFNKLYEKWADEQPTADDADKNVGGVTISSEDFNVTVGRDMLVVQQNNVKVFVFFINKNIVVKIKANGEELGKLKVVRA